MELPAPQLKRVMLFSGFGILGASAGYAYYHFIGCVSGTCPITSNPWMSTGYGAVLGLLLAPKRKHRTHDDSAPAASTKE